MRIKIIGIYVESDAIDRHVRDKFNNNTKSNLPRWNDIEFIGPLDASPYDAVIVLNTVRKPYWVRTNPGNVFALMQESNIRHKYLAKGLWQYNKVLSPISGAKNVILSHGYLAWGVQQNYLDLRKVSYAKKEKILSTVTSNLTRTPGHKKRVDFIEEAKKQLAIDHWGRGGGGNTPIKDKWDGLHPYYYSIAIENDSIPHYFTEKINDCFLSFTIPFYYGCTNIGEYFPKDAYIWIDITRPQYAIDKIKDILKNENPMDRKDALIEARERVLENYHLGAAATRLKEYMTIESKRTKRQLLLPVVSIKNAIKSCIKMLLGMD